MKITYRYRNQDISLKEILKNPGVVDRIYLPLSLITFKDRINKFDNFVFHEQIIEDCKRLSDVGVEIFISLLISDNSFTMFNLDFLKTILKSSSWIKGIDLNFSDLSVPYYDPSHIIRGIQKVIINVGSSYPITITISPEGIGSQRLNPPQTNSSHQLDSYPTDSKMGSPRLNPPQTNSSHQLDSHPTDSKMGYFAQLLPDLRRLSNSKEQSSKKANKKRIIFNIIAGKDLFSLINLEKILDLGFRPEEIIWGIESDNYDRKKFRKVVRVTREIKIKYPGLHGILCDDYSLAPPGPSPIRWAELMFYLVK